MIHKNPELKETEDLLSGNGWEPKTLDTPMSGLKRHCHGFSASSILFNTGVVEPWMLASDRDGSIRDGYADPLPHDPHPKSLRQFLAQLVRSGGQAASESLPGSTISGEIAAHQSAPNVASGESD